MPAANAEQSQRRRGFVFLRVQALSVKGNEGCPLSSDDSPVTCEQIVWKRFYVEGRAVVPWIDGRFFVSSAIRSPRRPRSGALFSRDTCGKTSFSSLVK